MQIFEYKNRLFAYKVIKYGLIVKFNVFEYKIFERNSNLQYKYICK